jgi:hypothetical protein
MARTPKNTGAPEAGVPSGAPVGVSFGQRPTLPRTCARSTIGAEELNFRVRDGNGWVLLATITQKLLKLVLPRPSSGLGRGVGIWTGRTALARARWLERLGGSSKKRVHFMVKPNGRLVPVSSTHYCAYTSGLSTWSSSTALVSGATRLGDLILGKVSRLYAFSAYPDRTSLPSGAPGGTTGSQEVRSSRSSRTKDKPPQISYAHRR